MNQQCKATKKDGSRCQSFTSASGDFCFWHDPNRRQAQNQARIRGGSTTATQRRRKTASPEDAPPPPKTIEEAIEVASWASWAVVTGKLDSRTGHDVGYILRAFIDGKKHVDKVDARVKAIEKRLGDLRALADD